MHLTWASRFLYTVRGLRATSNMLGLDVVQCHVQPRYLSASYVWVWKAQYDSFSQRHGMSFLYFKLLKRGRTELQEMKQLDLSGSSQSKASFVCCACGASTCFLSKPTGSLLTDYWVSWSGLQSHSLLNAGCTVQSMRQS